MTRCLGWVLFWVGLPALAFALDLRPAEAPPDDFPGRQYVDSRGCVFLRSEAGRWEARSDRDGEPVCGYPPSSTIRGASGRARLRALDPDAGKSRGQLMEEALARAIVPNLRPGELTSDPSAPESLPDMGPEPMATAPLDALRASLRAAPALRESMALKLQPNRRLCALLGYDAGGSEDADGRDPTSGYCGAAAVADLSRLVVMRPVGVEVSDPMRAADKLMAVPRREAKAGGARSGKGKAAGAVQTTPRIAMIPAAARYVGLGSFRAGAESEVATRRAAALGYPVQRERGRNGERISLLAGPFETREAIVRALDHLRRSGFGAARPR